MSLVSSQKSVDFRMYPFEGAVIKLIDLVRHQCSPVTPGPDPVRVLMPGVRTVVGSYYHGCSFNLETSDSALPAKEVEPLVRTLLREGTSFATRIGTQDLVCRLYWTIS